MGIDYTRKEFELLLKLMKTGFFLYPDTIEIEDVQQKGYVIVRGFAPADNSTDPRVVAISDNIDKIEDLINDSIVKDVPPVFRTMFADTAITAILHLIDNDIYFYETLRGVIYECNASEHPTDCKIPAGNVLKIASEFSDMIGGHVKISATPIVAAKLNKMFRYIAVNHYCTHCQCFVDKVSKVSYTVNRVLDGIPKTETLPSFACKSCVKAKPYNKPVIIDTVQNRNDACSCGSGKKFKKCCMSAI